MEIVLQDERSVLPSKAHSSDIGYDLTLIDIWKSMENQRIVFYETGIAVKPPSGYYVEVVPRSSFSKTGYVIANSVGIIDPEYRGTIKVALLKVLPDMPDLELPYKGFQMIIRPMISFPIRVVDSLDNTERGDGSFGSTNSK